MQSMSYLKNYNIYRIIVYITTIWPKIKNGIIKICFKKYAFRDGLSFFKKSFIKKDFEYS